MIPSLKTHASASKAAKSRDVASLHSSSGRNGAACAPPAYGIDYVDFGGRTADGLAPGTAQVVRQTIASSPDLVAKPHADRLMPARSPSAENESHALETLARTVQRIASAPGKDAACVIYHQGKRIAIPREQAQQLRATLVAKLKRAAQEIQSRSSYYWDRYNLQVAVNHESPIVSRISGWLADVEDPADELRARYFWLCQQVRTLQTLLLADKLVEAAALLAPIELVGEEIGQLSRTFYEGHIEGTEVAVDRLEFIRDASLAVAGSIASVVVAPLVAGAVGAGGLGLTGASAIVASVGGTGMVVGSGMAGVRGTSAAGGVFLAGGSLNEAGSAFTAETRRGFLEGFRSGAGGAAAHSVGLAIKAAGGTLTKQVATRVGSELLINGATAMVDVLARGGTIEAAARAAVITAAQAVPGALLGGSKNPVVRQLLVPFTAGGTAYLAARGSGASPEGALAQAGVALASSIAMSRALHTPDADAAFVERGRSIGAGLRKTVVSTAYRGASHAEAAVMGASDALPTVRSGYGGASIVIEGDLGGAPVVSVPTPKTAPAKTIPSLSVPPPGTRKTGSDSSVVLGGLPPPHKGAESDTLLPTTALKRHAAPKPGKKAESGSASPTTQPGSGKAKTRDMAPDPATRVWANTGTGRYHKPDSRHYGKTKKGRYMTLADAETEGYVQAGAKPPSGVYSVERPSQGDPCVVIKSWIGESQQRAKFEREMMSASQYAVREWADFQLVHSQPAGLGVESRAAIRLASKLVNQTLQNRGIERFLCDLRDRATGERLHLTTVTRTRARTLALESIHYIVERPEGGRMITLFEAVIEMRLDGSARAGVRMAGSDNYSLGPWLKP